MNVNLGKVEFKIFVLYCENIVGLKCVFFNGIDIKVVKKVEGFFSVKVWKDNVVRCRCVVGEYFDDCECGKVVFF